MSTVPADRRRALRATLADPTWAGTALAGTILVAALVAAQAGASAAAALLLAGTGALGACAVLAPSALRAVHRAPGLLVLAVLAGAGTAWLLGAGLVGWDPTGRLNLPFVAAVELLPLALAALAALGGVVLLADALRVRLGLAATSRTPWQRITGGARAGASPVGGVLAGGALIVLAAVLGVGFLSPYAAGSSGLELLLLLGVGLAIAVVVGAPLLVGTLAQADRSRSTDALQDERQRIAAHLHDSVLQTLALVQRQAHDPQAVTRLARRQEHDLRSWMAGDSVLGSDTLAGALRDVIAEVEDERGLSVEVSVLGDRPLEAAGEALSAAVREALRNAARHAPVSPVFVFCEITPDGVEAFVRDEGPGFVLGAVPRERRGVRDAIVGRMTAVGGHASVESVPGEGTEVVLRLGVAR